MPALPDDLTDSLKLADWLELSTISSPNGSASQGHLERILRQAALYELADNEEIERQIIDVFSELEQRTNAAQDAYPFNLDNQGSLKLKSSNWEDFIVYIFCLCLSYFPLRETREGPRLFERISCLAAKRYLQGEAIGFGSPRRELPSSFEEAITEICKKIGEGGGYKAQPVLDRKDDTLDIVAWKDFTDRRPSKLLMFGQCGAGRNWADKLGELQPSAFWRQWIRDGSISPDPIKSFFTPYQIGRNYWELYSRKGGILFDRCRIASLVHQEIIKDNTIISWIENFLAQNK
ncbi:MAG: hypothetical protein JW934_15300 [Anaerolineae bacterium]|nr:hypothetical protein [Anaerolineae bacterium]